MGMMVSGEGVLDLLSTCKTSPVQTGLMEGEKKILTHYNSPNSNVFFLTHPGNSRTLVECLTVQLNSDTGYLETA